MTEPLPPKPAASQSQSEGPLQVSLPAGWKLEYDNKYHFYTITREKQAVASG